MRKIRKGKILRLKQGYNPNSSSMGSIVFALPAALLVVTSVFGLASGIIISAFMKDENKKHVKKELTPDQEQ